ncbi:MAG TPA: hypothetical protein VG028_21595 [Terriglobia bacterium]|nr:hypothetical protein [Terriglobia bacterium]
MPEPQLQGSVLVLILYDICEEIRLEDLRQILGAQPPGREPSFKHPAPEYVRFQRPPVVETVAAIALETGETVTGRMKYYDYGVVSVEFQLPFKGDWESLVNLSSRHVAGQEFEKRAIEVARQKVKRVIPALVKPYENWLTEDYYIFHIVEAEGHPLAANMVKEHGDEIAQIVRGENVKLSDEERREVLASCISYYPSDLAVLGWNAAFLYDTVAGAVTTIQLLEYANSQLLEFRYYDEVLTRRLASVYQSLDKGTGFMARWRLARASARLHTLLLDVTELTERTDNAIKFLSDMFSARLYRLAANKVGVLDYKSLVQQKIDTAENLYKFMVDQFNQGRAFVLELMVVIILIIELVFFFGGKG